MSDRAARAKRRANSQVPETAEDRRHLEVERTCHRPGCGNTWKAKPNGPKLVWCSVNCWRNDAAGEPAEQ